MKAASVIPFTTGLHDLGDGVWAYLQPDGSMGLSNAGLVAGNGSSLLVDTLFDLPSARAMLDSMAPILDQHPLIAAVNTHANPDHMFGNQLLPLSIEVWSSSATAAEFDDFPPSAMAAHQQQGVEAGPSPLARFDFSNIVVRHPDETFTGVQELSVAGRTVRLLEVGPAHTKGDVVVYAPEPGVVIAGDILFVGILPMMWAGPADNWIAALDQIIALEPALVIPGHGPVTDVAGVRRARDLMAFVQSEARRCQKDGMTVMEAVSDIGPGPFHALLEPERIVNLVDMIYRDRDPNHAPMSPTEAHHNMAAVAERWAQT